MKTKIKIYQVDTFTSKLFSGKTKKNNIRSKHKIPPKYPLPQAIPENLPKEILFLKSNNLEL